MTSRTGRAALTWRRMGARTLRGWALVRRFARLPGHAGPPIDSVGGSTPGSSDPSHHAAAGVDPAMAAERVLAVVATACDRQRRLQFGFRSRDGVESVRDIEPYRVIQSGARRYVLGFDVERDDWRTFRLDRMRPLPVSGPSFVPREIPTGTDAPYLSPGRAGSERGTAIESGALPSPAAVRATARWAAQMLAPGAAVVLDTETTDLPGAICELAVVDAATGEILLDTLVDPGLQMSPRAQAVHGIAAADLVGAPTWAVVLPRLLDVVGDRIVLAYNVEFDRAVIRADSARYALGLGALDAAERWGCVMLHRARVLPGGSPLALGAGHRACGDAVAALQVLRELAAMQPAVHAAVHAAVC